MNRASLSSTPSYSIPSNLGYRGELSPLSNLHLLEAQWLELQATSISSFFLSWSWIGTWLKMVGPKANLQLYRCYCDDELVAMAIVGHSEIKRRFFFQSRILTLNELSDNAWNMFIEYNGLLAKQGHEAFALKCLFDDLHDTENFWDEIQVTNIPQENYSQLCRHNIELQSRDESSQSLWITSLNSDTTSDSIINQMSKNRRWQIRRTFKEYEKEGELTISTARSMNEALEYFEQMGILHTQRWQRVGANGAFSRPCWVDFHKNLIRQAFDRGEIQLLRIACGPRTIGYIYNLLWQSTVHMLQSGFVKEQSNLLRPGYVSHILAMQFNAKRGAKQYDFMIGDSEYKRALATQHPPLISARLQKPRFKFLIENSLVALHRKLRAWNLISPGLLGTPRTVVKNTTQGLLIALDPIFNLVSFINPV
jgi:hypothetical protein